MQQASYLDRMMELLLSAEVAPVPRLIDDFRAARISADQMADHYIPAAARKLGEDWLADRASFAQVTIGVARLQDMLHTIQQDWWADNADPVSQSAVLVIVPPGEQHSLGAMVVASVLRRRGISVCLRIAPGLSDLALLLADRRFDAAFISVGGADKVEMCAKLVKTLSQISSGKLHIAIGGCVAEHSAAMLAATGAHIVSNDVGAVIAAFGLTVRPTLLTG